MSGDGCTEACQVELGYVCNGATSTTRDTCTEVCGDGISYHQGCDDANTFNKDG